MEEINNKKQLKQSEMIKEIKGAELDVMLMKKRIEQEKINEEKRVQRFKDFDAKYEQKNEWF